MTSISLSHPIELRRGAEDRTMRIRWSDEHRSEYPWVYLRGWCPCATCQGHSSQTRFIEVPNPRLTGYEPVGRYALRFLWADGHSTGMYSFDWLKEIADFSECRS